jgi:hypothetical protein
LCRAAGSRRTALPLSVHQTSYIILHLTAGLPLFVVEPGCARSVMKTASSCGDLRRNRRAGMETGRPIICGTRRSGQPSSLSPVAVLDLARRPDTKLRGLWQAWVPTTEPPAPGVPGVKVRHILPVISIIVLRTLRWPSPAGHLPARHGFTISPAAIIAFACRIIG